MRGKGGGAGKGVEIFPVDFFADIFKFEPQYKYNTRLRMVVTSHLEHEDALKYHLPAWKVITSILVSSLPA